jgi:hypothetical protein
MVVLGVDLTFLAQTKLMVVVVLQVLHLASVVMVVLVVPVKAAELELPLEILDGDNFGDILALIQTLTAALFVVFSLVLVAAC